MQVLKLKEGGVIWLDMPPMLGWLNENVDITLHLK